jgi:small subunit ribosomal protein S15
MKPKKQQLTPQEARDAAAGLRLHEGDVGSPQSQIARLTSRIIHLTGHMSQHRGDKHSRRGLIGLVNSRRRLLKYLKRKDPQKHSQTLLALNLRK